MVILPWGRGSGQGPGRVRTVKWRAQDSRAVAMPFEPRKFLKIAEIVSQSSRCLRSLPGGVPAHFAALVLDEEQNVLLASGYNGWLRGGTPTCGGYVDGSGTTACARETQNIPSGDQVEVGCVHAEMNALANCCRQGVKTVGMVMLVPAEPCKMCAKLIVQAGIRTVYLGAKRYRNNGLEILTAGGVTVRWIPPEPAG